MKALGQLKKMITLATKVYTFFDKFDNTLMPFVTLPCYDDWC